jgi:tetratricopeptide (TPR) repeat protein
MLDSSLDIPDAPSWQFEPGYSSDIARRLINAYRRLRQGATQTASYLAVYDEMESLLHQRMSATQRMHVNFVLGMACSAKGDYAEAYSRLSEAAAQALAMQDLAAYVTVTVLRANISNCVMDFGRASSEFRACLDVVRLMDEESGKQDHVTLQVELLGRGAFCEYWVGHLSTAQAMLAEGTRLARVSVSSELEVATLNWLQGHLHRASGNLSAALMTAMAAAGVYLAKGNPASTVRCQYLVSEIALDLAESFPGGVASTAGSSYVALAGSYANRALEMSRSLHDRPGEGLVLLTHARYTRMSGHDISMLDTVESVDALGHQLGDGALRTQAYEKLAHEMTLQGRTDSALDLYRRTVSIAEQAAIPFLAVQARRALLRASEMRV